METRKVQLTGSSTFTISLPKEWACERGVEPGMSLTLCPGVDGELVIGAEQTADDSTPRVDVSGVPAATVGRIVRTLYALGYGEFVLVAEGDLTGEKRRAAASAAGDLLGLEVERETDDELALTTLLDTPEVAVEQTLVQLQFAALSMHRDAVDALADPDTELARQAAARDGDVTRRATALRRCYERTLTDVTALRRLGLSRTALFDHYECARQLERVAGTAVRTTNVDPDGERSPEWFDDYRTLARRVRDDVAGGVESVLADGPLEEVTDHREACAHRRDEVAAFAAEARRRDPAYCPALDGLRTAAERSIEIADLALRSTLRER